VTPAQETPVHQRNAQPYSLIVGDDPPYLAPPGHEVDHPDLLAGFEPVDAPTTPDPAPGPAARGKRAATKTNPDEEASP
jgi:hypothetical protein